MNAGGNLTLRRMRPLLGSFVEIGVFRPGARAAAAVCAAFAECARVESLMSFQDPQSELSRLNGARGRHLRLSPLTLRVLRLARDMTAASGGLFNCTVGGALVEQGRLPDHGAAHAVAMGAAQDLQLESETARLRRPVLVTLDGIAKGFAIDRALARLRQHGIRHAWANAGGDIRVIGDSTLPVALRGKPLVLQLANAALATSASRAGYDKAFAAHIVGESTPDAVGEWSVLAAQAWRADALTKVAALAARGQRERLLARLGGRLVLPRALTAPGWAA